MLNTAKHRTTLRQRSQARLRFEELESRNLLSILGFPTAVAVTISLEPLANAVQLAPAAVSASAAMVQNEASSQAGTVSDVSLGNELTSQLPAGIQTPRALQTSESTVIQTVRTLVQDVDKIVPTPIISPVVRPAIPGLPPVVSPVTIEPSPDEPPVSIPPLPVAGTPGQGASSPILPVATTGPITTIPPVTTASATNPEGVPPIVANGAPTALPPNPTAQVQSSGVADTGGLPVPTAAASTNSLSAERSGFRVESGGGDEELPLDWLPQLPGSNEETRLPGAGTEDNTPKIRTAEALLACDTCFSRATLKLASTEEGETTSEVGGPAWMLDPGTAVAALALAVGGFEWGVRPDGTARRQRRLVQI